MFIWSSFSCFCNLIGVVLLDNPCCMRLGGLSGGLNIEDGEPSIHKKGRAIICISHFCHLNYV